MIRLSTSTIYQSGLNGILQNESAVSYVQQQLSSGRKVVTPSDDPLAAGQAITAFQNLNMTAAYGSNRDAANRSLGTESNALGTVVSTVTDALTRIVQAGNGTLADQDRNTLATVLEQARDALYALGNTTDGNGQYLFSGTAGDVQAFTKDAAGNVTYSGNRGQRVVQVEQSRQMSVSDIGADIFSRATPGASGYIAEAAGGNTGTATFEAATVSPGSSFANDYQIAFSKDAAGVVTYQVTATDPVSGTTSTGPVTAYTPGGAIDLGGGVSMVVNGDPENGDNFTVTSTQSPNANLDMFATLNSVITALKDPAQNDAAAQSKLVNLLATANKKLTINLDNVSTVQASVGARQNELDALDTTGTSRELSDSKTLTDLTQINYYSAISTMSMRQLSLQASMSAFSAVKGTSLFSMNK